jgi:cellulose synthase/poly-beta-1,6-N-acetylglucosamine synthase-like glycosyltransferase
MTQFEYVSVLVSILIAFALSEVLGGWGRLIRARERVRFSLLHLLVSVLAMLLMVQFWAGFWQYRGLPSWGFAQVLAIVCDCLSLVVIAFVLMPAVPAEGPLDLEAQYWRNQRWLYGLAGVQLVLLAAVDALVGGQPFVHAENLIRGIGLGVVALLAVSARRALHLAVLLASYGLFAVFVAVAWRQP